MMFLNIIFKQITVDCNKDYLYIIQIKTIFLMMLDDQNNMYFKYRLIFPQIILMMNIFVFISSHVYIFMYTIIFLFFTQWLAFIAISYLTPFLPLCCKENHVSHFSLSSISLSY